MPFRTVVTMERQKALTAASIVTVGLMASAVAFAANSGLVSGRSDHVGELPATAVASTVTTVAPTPTTKAPTVITVYIDPVTGSVVAPPSAGVTVVTAPSAPPAAAPADTAAPVADTAPEPPPDEPEAPPAADAPDAHEENA